MSLGNCYILGYRREELVKVGNVLKVVEVSRAPKVLGARGVGSAESGANKINE